MEVAPARDFDFNYTSAPSSPRRLTELYCGFDELLISAGTHRISSLATVPFAWEEKPGVPKASMSKRMGQASAHERHYNLNRAVSNDMKKRTYLPYRQGILGGLSFNA
ncbi:hypothetical protein L1887_20472 [Cichorium endivia]|nr:hypothetical protein L1887_20472 [Cichorium endivia]